jgi:ribonucleoside-triphosphate reductase
MVPYVRKSFRKHWNDALKYIAFWPVSESNMCYDPTPINEYPDCDDYKDIYRYAMEMTERETMQAVEAMYHNLNTLQSRSGNQLPFTSINYGTCTLPEGRLVTKCLIEGSIKGIGKLHKTSIFPCGIF